MRRALMLCAFASATLAAQPVPRVAFVNVDVLTMEDGAQYRRGQTVLIDGERIRELGANVAIPADARRIDGRGLVLMPGLMDMHVHLEADPVSWIGAFLGYGVTTVLNLRGGPTHLELRDRVNRREVLGPKIYTSGAYVNRPAVETEQDAARAVREQKAAGYDVIKIHGPLGNLAYRTVIDTAHALGLPVVGHAPRNLAFDSVIVLKQDMVAHAEELIYTKFSRLDTTAFGDIPARMAAAHTWLVPTLSTFHGIATQWARPASADSALKSPEASFFNADFTRFWIQANPYTGRAEGEASWARNAYEFQRPLIRALHAAGVRLMTGTDTPLPIMVPGASLHLEIAELRAAGLSSYDALLAATRNPGDFLRALVDKDSKSGRVAAGYTADLVLVRGDPLNNLAVLRAPIGVMTRGRFLDSTQVAALRASGK